MRRARAQGRAGFIGRLERVAGTLSPGSGIAGRADAPLRAAAPAVHGRRGLELRLLPAPGLPARPGGPCEHVLYSDARTRTRTRRCHACPPPASRPGRPSNEVRAAQHAGRSLLKHAVLHATSMAAAGASIAGAGLPAGIRRRRLRAGGRAAGRRAARLMGMTHGDHSSREPGSRVSRETAREPREPRDSPGAA